MIFIEFAFNEVCSWTVANYYKEDKVMYKKLLAVVIIFVFVIGASGCVWKPVYNKKVAESAALKIERDALANEKGSLLQDKELLAKEKKVLANKIANLEAAIGALGKENAKLLAEKAELEGQIALLKKQLVDVSEKYLLLENEAKELKEAIAVSGTKSVKSERKPQQVFK